MTTTELYPNVPPPTPEDMTIDYGRDYKFWSSRDTTLDGLRPSIVTILSTLRIAAHHARRAAAAERRLAERDAEIERLRATLAERDATIGRLRDALAKISSAAADTGAELVDLWLDLKEHAARVLAETAMKEGT